jgi:hypothetical protein
LTAVTATNFARYVVKVWELKRRANDDRPRVNQPALAITRAAVLADPRELRLTIPRASRFQRSPPAPSARNFLSRLVLLVSASDQRSAAKTLPLKFIPPNDLSHFGVA